MVCNHCHKEMEPFYQKINFHIGEFCSSCMSWIRWVPKEESKEKGYDIQENNSTPLW